MYSKVDVTSFSNPTRTLSTSIDINWKINFETKIISGTVKHSITVIDPTSTTVDFDSSKLNITKVTTDGNTVLDFITAKPHPKFGSKISVLIPEQFKVENAQFDITFHYSTDPEATAGSYFNFYCKLYV